MHCRHVWESSTLDSDVPSADLAPFGAVPTPGMCLTRRIPPPRENGAEDAPEADRTHTDNVAAQPAPFDPVESRAYFQDLFAQVGQLVTSVLPVGTGAPMLATSFPPPPRTLGLGPLERLVREQYGARVLERDHMADMAVGVQQEFELALHAIAGCIRDGEVPIMQFLLGDLVQAIVRLSAMATFFSVEPRPDNAAYLPVYTGICTFCGVMFAIISDIIAAHWPTVQIPDLDHEIREATIAVLQTSTNPNAALVLAALREQVVPQGAAFSIMHTVSIEEATRESVEHLAGQLHSMEISHSFPGIEHFLGMFADAGRKAGLSTGVIQKCVGGILAAIAVSRTTDRLARVCIVGAFVSHVCTPLDAAGVVQAALVAITDWCHSGPSAQALGTDDTEQLSSVVGGCFSAICSIFEPKGYGQLRLDKAAVDSFSSHVMAALRVGDLISFAMRLVSWVRSTAVRLTCGVAPLEDYTPILEKATTWAQAVLDVRTQNSIQDFATTPEKVTRIALLREEGNELVRLSFARKELSTLASHVQRLQATLTDFHESIRSYGTLGHRRPEPFAVYLFGRPGQGKSAVVDLLIAAAAKAFGLEYTPAMRYTRNAVSRFWDGYHGQFACVFDDFLQSGDISLRAAEISDWIHCVNNMPYMLNMAALGEKSATFFTSSLVVATTNEGQLIGSNRTGITDTGAFHRRRDLVLEVTLADGSGGSLDPTRWTFKSYPASEEGAGRTLSFTDVVRLVVQGIAHRVTGAASRQDEINAIATSVIADIALVHPATIVAQAGEDDIATVVPVDPAAGVGPTPTSTPPPPEPVGNHQERRAERRAAEAQSRLQRATAFMRARYAGWTKGGDHDNDPAVASDVSHVAAMHDAVVRLHGQSRKALELMTQHSKDLLASVGSLSDDVRLRYSQAIEAHKWLGHLSVAVASLVTVWTMWRTYKWATATPPMPEPDYGFTAEGRGTGRPSDERKIKGRKHDSERWRTRPGGHETVTVIGRSGGYTDPIEPESTSDETALTIEKSIRANFVRIRVTARDPDGNKHVCAVDGLFVKGNAILTVGHAVRLATMYEDEEGSSTAMVQFCYPGGSFADVPARDCRFVIHKSDIGVIFPPPTIGARPTIVKHFIRNADVQPGPVDELKLVGLSGDGAFTRLDCPHAMLSTTVPKQYTAYGFEFRVADTILSRCDTENGDCGSLYVRYDKGQNRKLLGLHTAGSDISTARAIGSIVTQELLEDLLARVRASVAELATAPYAQGATDEFPTVSLGPTFRTLAVVSPQLKPRLPQDTEIHHSAIEPMLAEIPRKKAPAHLRPFKGPSGDRIRPMEVAADFPSHHVGAHVPFAYLDEVAGTLYMEIGRDIEPRVLTEFEMVNGDHMIELEKIAMDSSPGYPQVLQPRVLAGKRDWYKRIHETWVMGDALRSEVEAAEASLSRGERFGAVFMDMPKDELIKLAKVESGKTRLLGASPHVFTLLTRKYFGRAIQQFIAGRHRHFGAVGMRPDSFEWKQQYDYLMSIPNGRWMAGDFREFFATHPANVVYYILFQLTKWYDPEVTLDSWLERQPERFALACEIVHAVHIIGNVIYVTDHGHPSGSSLTTVINTFATEIYLRMCFLQCVDPKVFGSVGPTTMSDYRQHTRNKAFGDDHNTRVSALVADFFNQKVFAEWCLRYNLEYTDAYKNTDPDPFTTDEDLVFLKRKYAVQNNGWVDAPMEMQVLHEMVLWVTGPRGDHRRTAQIIENSLEMATEHPRQVFDKWKQRLGAAMHYMGWRFGYEVRDIHYDHVRNRRPGFIRAQGERIWPQSGRDEMADEVVTHQVEITEAQNKEETGPPSHYVGNYVWHAGPSFPGQDFGAAFRRKYIVQRIPLPSGQTPGHVIQTNNLLELVTQNDLLVSALTRFRFFRADVVLTFKFNASVYHGGAIGVLWSPPSAIYTLMTDAMTGVSDTVTALQSLVTGHHTIISADKWRVMQMTIPFNRSMPWVDNLTMIRGNASPGLTIGLEQLGKLTYMCVAPIVTGLSTASSTLYLTVELELRNVEVDCPWTQAGAPAENIRPQGGDDREKRRPKPQVKEAEAKAKSGDGEQGESRKWYQVVARYVGQGVETAIAWAVPTLGRMVFGLSKPTDVSAQILVVPDHRARNGVADGVDNTNSLGTFQAHEVSADPAIFGWQGDSLDLGVRARHPGYLVRFSFDGSDDAGANITYWPVHPLNSPTILSPNGNRALVRHHLAHTASHFRYWRGGIRYRVHLFAPRTMTARIRIVWSPDSYYYVVPLDDTGDAPNIVVDIAGDTVVDFTVPFTGQYLWKRTQFYGATSDILNLDAMYTNGYVLVQLVSPVIAMDFAETSLISGFVTVAGAEDFDVADHVGVVNNGLSITDPPAPGRVWAQGSEHEAFKSAVEGIAGSRSVLYDGLVHGEQVKSWREVLKRYEFSFTLVSSLHSFVIQTPFAQWFGADQWDIVSAFRFMRGARRGRVSLHMVDDDTGPRAVVATLAYGTSRTPSGAASYATTSAVANGSGGVSSECQINLEAPFFSNVAYSNVTKDYSEQVFTDAMKCGIVVDNPGVTAIKIAVYSACGDDFSAGWPCVPALVYIPSPAAIAGGRERQEPLPVALCAEGGKQGFGNLGTGVKTPEDQPHDGPARQRRGLNVTGWIPL